MFLHIGDSRVVFLEDLVGIFNMNLQDNPTTLQFLESFPTEKGRAKDRNTSNSFVITTDKIYYSLISPLTLQRRVQKNQL
jgi:hypothetical protein